MDQELNPESHKLQIFCAAGLNSSCFLFIIIMIMIMMIIIIIIIINIIIIIIIIFDNQLIVSLSNTCLFKTSLCCLSNENDLIKVRRSPLTPIRFLL